MQDAAIGRQMAVRVRKLKFSDTLPEQISACCDFFEAQFEVLHELSKREFADFTPCFELVRSRRIEFDDRMDHAQGMINAQDARDKKRMRELALIEPS